MASLKLLALDDEDLQVISVHLQDAILRARDMAWNPGANRFVALLNRFDWQAAQKADERGKTHLERCRCALRFDAVRAIQLKNINVKDKKQTLELLMIKFEAGDPPSGRIELIFAENCSARLDVDYIEAELTDLGAGWKARSMPEHEG